MQLTNDMILVMLIIAIVLFFWGSIKAMKTQKKVYLWAMVPMGILIVGMFFL